MGKWVGGWEGRWVGGMLGRSPTWSKGSSTHATGLNCFAVSQISTSSEVSSAPPAPPSAHVTENERDDPFCSTRGTFTLLIPSPALA